MRAIALTVALIIAQRTSDHCLPQWSNYTIHCPLHPFCPALYKLWSYTEHMWAHTQNTCERTHRCLLKHILREPVQSHLSAKNQFELFYC